MPLPIYLPVEASAVEVLAEVVKAVGPLVEVYVDGGVTRGTDVIKVRTTHKTPPTYTLHTAFSLCFIFMVV